MRDSEIHCWVLFVQAVKETAKRHYLISETHEDRELIRVCDNLLDNGVIQTPSDKPVLSGWGSVLECNAKLMCFMAEFKHTPNSDTLLLWANDIKRYLKEKYDQP